MYCKEYMQCKNISFLFEERSFILRFSSIERIFLAYFLPLKDFRTFLDIEKATNVSKAMPPKTAPKT